MKNHQPIPMFDYQKQELFGNFPTLYTTNPTIECSVGVVSLIDIFSTLLEARSKEVYIDEIKVDYGMLLIKVEGYKPQDGDYIFGLTNLTACLSHLICENCGNKGLIFNCPGTMNPRCDLHGGFPFDNSRREIDPNLPFSLDHMGLAWSEMISDFYLKLVMHTNINDMPEVVINKVEKKSGKLVIDFTGGNEIAHGMLDLLLAYTSITDDKTGDLI